MPRRASKRSMTRSQMRPFDEKKWGMNYGELQERMRRYGQDLSWCHNNEARLRKKHPDRWVAVKDRKIVMTDDDFDRILKRLRERPGGIADECIFFVSSVEYELVI